jgi:diphosphomevalonate decarboxylase
VSAFAPTNIALIKYWGKRNQELNLPITNSLSFALPVGTTTSLSSHQDHDVVTLNGTLQGHDSAFTKRLVNFVNKFRPHNSFLKIDTVNQIPTAAGLASSASGFAALTLAMNELFNWKRSPHELSIIARQGSGSACRSLFSGFVEWHKGSQDNGEDSFAEPLNILWPEFKMGLWIFSEKEKPIDSRKAMQQTVATSPLFSAWPEIVASDLAKMRQALIEHNFSQVGEIAEHNALSMHAMMMGATPPILYWLKESVEAMHQVWRLRKTGVEVYFTMDAGPNLKLIYLEETKPLLQRLLPHANLILF